MNTEHAALTLSGDGTVTISGVKGWPHWEFVVAGEAVTVRPPEGIGLDVETWRRLPIGRVLRRARMLRREGDTIDLRLAVAHMIASRNGDPDDSARGGQRAHLQLVAQVYRFAIEQNLNPRQTVAHAFEKSDVTAGRWIAKARENGVLDSNAAERAKYGVRMPKGQPLRVFDQDEPLPEGFYISEDPDVSKLRPRRVRQPGRGSTAAQAKRDEQQRGKESK